MGVMEGMSTGIVLFRHVYKIWKENLPLKGTFLYPDVCQLHLRCSFTFLNMNFFHQIVAHLPK